MSHLVTVVLWALFVANSLWPPRLRGRAGFFVYLLSMTVNELPMLFLALVIAGIGSTLVDGAPPGWWGIAWWAAWALNGAGLLWMQLRARAARPALEAGLTAALGDQWRAAIRPDLGAVLRTRTPWLAGIALPLQRRHPAVERVRNLPYGPDRRAHRLDVYRNPRSPGERPVLIHFHEGGFVQGGKSRESVTLLNQLAAHGWLCISADYRLRDEAVFPNPLVDAKRVIAWVRNDAVDLGADRSQVFLIGCSAGAHIAVSAALTPNRSELQPGFEDADTSVAGVVSLYGYLGARTDDPMSSPVDLVGPESPPMLLVQGGNDTDLPHGAPREWARMLQSASQSPVAYAELPHAQHAFDLYASVRARVAANAIEAFLAWVRSHSPNQV